MGTIVDFANKIDAVAIGIGTNVFVASISALIAVWLAFRRFRRERLWEIKFKAYGDLLHALHNIRRDTDISLRASEIQSNTETDFHKEWSKKHTQAWDEIRKQIDVSELFLSVKSVAVLQNFVKESQYDGDFYFEHLEAISVAVNKCLPQLKAEARRDLGITLNRMKSNYS